MTKVKRWTEVEMVRLRNLAAAGIYGVDIAVAFGVTFHSIVTIIGREKIPANLYTPSQQEQRAAKQRAREKAKYEARRAKEAAKSGRRQIVIATMTSRTHPAYRNQLPRLPEGTSKYDLRRMLSEAARNTAEMALEA